MTTIVLDDEFWQMTHEKKEEKDMVSRPLQPTWLIRTESRIHVRPHLEDSPKPLTPASGVSPEDVAM